MQIRILKNLLLWVNKLLGKEKALRLLNIITNKQKFFYIDQIYDFEEKITVPRLTVFLPGKGCEWGIKTGGCTMCAFWKKAQKWGQKFSANDLISLFEIAINLTFDDRPTNLTIYNGGSFLNEKEIPLKTQIEICRKVKTHPFLKLILIESRVEFITEKKIDILKKELGNKILKIGIGLESQDDKIRNFLIKKGLEKKEYEKAVKLLKEKGVKVLTYVFLKPIFLNEREALDEALKTIEYAFRVGTDEVALETAFIQEGTIMEKLFNEGKYKLPWLWSIIEIIRKTYFLGPVHIGGFEDEPPPISIPSNCPLCSEKIRDLIQKYRETHELKLFDNLYCQCYELWKKEVTY